MASLLLIAIGGAGGAIARYLLGGWVHGWAGTGFPWGTFAVNVLGCTALGLAMRLTEGLVAASEIRLLVAVGFLGAFTTFSTFSLETVLMIQRGDLLRALAYVSGSVLVGMAALWIGLGAPR